MEIPLSKGKVAIIDDEDYPKVSQYKWYATKIAQTWYAMAAPYQKGQYKSKSIMLHRLILGLTDKRKQVDHINGDGLNNQKSNLRVVTASQNRQNMRKTHGTSKYKGVSRYKTAWQAAIKSEQKAIRIGTFTDEDAAAIAYDKKAKELFGQYAWLNEEHFPEVRKRLKGDIE